MDTEEKYPLNEVEDWWLDRWLTLGGAQLYHGRSRNIKLAEQFYQEYLEGKIPDGTVLICNCEWGEMIEVLNVAHFDAIGVQKPARDPSLNELYEMHWDRQGLKACFNDPVDVLGVGDLQLSAACLVTMRDTFSHHITQQGGEAYWQVGDKMLRQDIRKILNGAANVLQPGGKLILQWPVLNNQPAFFRVIQEEVGKVPLDRIIQSGTTLILERRATPVPDDTPVRSSSSDPSSGTGHPEHTHPEDDSPGLPDTPDAAAGEDKTGDPPSAGETRHDPTDEDMG